MEKLNIQQMEEINGGSNWAYCVGAAVSGYGAAAMGALGAISLGWGFVFMGAGLILTCAISS